MAQQQYNVTPYLKNLQVYSDFSGGINARDTSDNMKDSELRHILNGDIIERGAVSKRKGMNYAYYTKNMPKGSVQGHYRYEYNDKRYDFIFSHGGVYRIDLSNVDITGKPQELTTTLMPIHKKDSSGNWVKDKDYYVPSGTDFREVSCVQKDGNVYMFTGHIPLVYVADKGVVGYMPASDITPIQASKLGYNLLADDPQNALKDGVAPILIAEGISTDKQVGVVNTNTRFTAWMSCPSADVGKVRIRWDIKEDGDEDYKTVKNWGAFSSNKTYDHVMSRDGGVSIRVYLCYEGEQTVPSGETEPRPIWKSAVLPNYQFKVNDENKPLEKMSVKTCNKVLVHKNKLLVWGSSAKDCQNKIFISGTEDFTYFPHYHYLELETPTQEAVETVTPLFTNLMAFTRNKIFKISGYSALNPAYFDVAPDATYEVELANGSYGTVAPKSVKSIGNELYFLSTEGVARLRTYSGSGDKYMVDLIDKKVNSKLPTDHLEHVVGARWNGHYSLIYPYQAVRWNLNIDYATWTVHHAPDSPKPVWKENMEFDSEPVALEDISFIQHPYFVLDAFVEEGVLYGVSRTTGALIHYNADWGWDGDIPFKFQMVSKDFSFGLPFHYKKYKELFILCKHGRQTPSKLKLSIESDKGTLLSSTKHTITVNKETNMVEYAEIEDPVGTLPLNGITKLNVWEVGLSYFPGFEYAFTHRLRFSGKAHSVTVTLEESSVNTFSLYGLGFTYKMKKPKA